MRNKRQRDDGCEQKEVTWSHQQCHGWMIQLLEGERGIGSLEMSPF